MRPPSLLLLAALALPVAADDVVPEDPAARLALGIRLYEQAGADKAQRARACRLLTGLSDALPDSMELAYYRGRFLAAGHCGVVRDPEAAVALYRQAAEAGVPDAMHRFALALRDGFGVRASPRAALGWHARAAEAGHGGSLWHLALAELDDEGPRDPERAIDFLRRAVEAGYPDAMASMGVMHAMGDGVPQDYAIALAWYQRAVEAGATHAYRNLAVMNLYGQGIPQDLDAARRYHRLWREAGFGPDPGLETELRLAGRANRKTDATPP